MADVIDIVRTRTKDQSAVVLLAYYSMKKTSKPASVSYWLVCISFYTDYSLFEYFMFFSDCLFPGLGQVTVWSF